MTFAKFLQASVSVSENLVSEKSLGLGFEESGLGKKVSVLKNLVSEKKSRFRRIWSRKKVSVSDNLVSEKSFGFGFGKFGLGKKVLVSVSFKILVSSFSDSRYQSHWKWWFVLVRLIWFE